MRNSDFSNFLNYKFPRMAHVTRNSNRIIFTSHFHIREIDRLVCPASILHKKHVCKDTISFLNLYLALISIS